MCTFDLCKMSSFCYLLETKTKTPIDITKFVEKEYIDVGAMSIPQLSGEWQVSVDLIQGKSVLGGFRIGKDNEWLTLESIEGEEEEIDTTKSDLERHREL
ncbi:hypothetical protein DICVIV_03066 [Dictyocaulus viviparus]|uniref:Uncharacterized protein n=1 Tax=Dictyocaulus viviparus TaxID=29172 RepID=A0A0D8Y8B5_DICVI|nr:hypothetical protein DICVIV_03066 [Dictyocaulus viviparus]